jgi:hypothetical protein
MINEEVYSFKSDLEADNALNRIMKLTGLPANFQIRASSVPNACAVIKCDDDNNCDRYILYNQEFMEKIKDETRSNFSELAVLAHEIAHHLSGHTLSNLGNSYDMELEADKFAGFILYKLGADLNDVKKAFSSLPIQGSETHPPRNARIAAVTNGWYDAKRNGETITNIPNENSNTNSGNQEIPKKIKTKSLGEKQTDEIKYISTDFYCKNCGKYKNIDGYKMFVCDKCLASYWITWKNDDYTTGKIIKIRMDNEGNDLWKRNEKRNEGIGIIHGL